MSAATQGNANVAGLRRAVSFISFLGGICSIPLTSAEGLRRTVSTATISTNCQGTITTQSVDVVVIGAGMSGLKAAQTIEDADADLSYVLLEGRDDVGGRMRKHTLPNGFVVEQGPNWINGGTGNPIYEMAMDLKLEVYDETADYDPWKVYDSATGQPYDRDVVASRLHDFYDAISCVSDRAADAWCRRMLKEGDAGVRVVLDECGWTPNNALDDEIEWAWIDWEYARPASQVSLYSYPESSAFGEGSYLVKDQRGYQYLAETMANSLRQDPVLSTEVTLIEWDNDDPDLPPARVHTTNLQDGSCTVYETNAVIPTVSIGVLSNRGDMFSPPLTDFAEKNVFNMGSFQKIFFTFEEAFWKNGAGTEEEDFIINVAMEDRQNKGRCSFFLSLDKGETPAGDISPTTPTDSPEQTTQQPPQPTVLELPNEDGKKAPGIMFTIDASADVTIETLYIQTLAGHSDPAVAVEVYTKEGTYNGFESDPSSWDQVFEGHVVGNGEDAMTKLDEDLFDPITIKGGQQQSIYVSVKSVAKRCANCLLGNKQPVATGRNSEVFTVSGGIGTMGLFEPSGKERAFTGAIVYTESGTSDRKLVEEEAFGPSSTTLPGSHTLFCTLVTEQVEKVGGQISDELAMEFLEPLKKIYGADNVNPTNIYAVSPWMEDPWTFGSYANWKVGAEPDDFYEMMNEPFRDMHDRSVIFLAGSAACLEHWETLMGAYYAGEMRAEETIAYLTGEKYDVYEHVCNA